MRASQGTLNDRQLRIPSARELRDRAVRVLSSEKAADAALSAITVMLFTWLLYCLARPFLHYQILF